MRRVGPLVLVVLLTSATSALATSGAHAGSPAPTRATLRGTNWVLTDRVSIGTPLRGVAVNAVFGSDRVEGSSGCNGYSSSYTTNGSRMTITNDGASTQIACPGAAGKVEPRYLAALERVGRYRIHRTTLTLSTRTGRRLLVYRASIGTQALRGKWDVVNFYTGTAVTSPAVGSTLTLEFAGDRASGNSGCNSFSGAVERSGIDGIALGPFASTLRACVDPAVGTQEQQYLAALELARAYQLTGDELTLFRDGGTIAATYNRATNS
jgi:heat shock protein HslJ